MGVRVLLVLPDLSEAKAEALRRVSRVMGPLDVLVSYSTLVWKPGVLPRLSALRGEGVLGLVMLDSGAYHLARKGIEVPVEDYARAASRGLWSLVVAPDVPGDPAATLARTRLFARLHPGRFVPVVQGRKPEEYALSLQALWREGLLDRAPHVGRGMLLGIGGLDGGRRRVSFIADLLRRLGGEARRLGVEPVFHLFGAGARIVRGLRRRGLLELVYSVDSSGWLAEIQYRRRTVYRASGPVEANAAAIRGYLTRVTAAAGATV